MRITRVRHTVQCTIRCTSAEFRGVHEESCCNGISYLCSCVGNRVLVFEIIQGVHLSAKEREFVSPFLVTDE